MEPKAQMLTEEHAVSAADASNTDKEMRPIPGTYTMSNKPDKVINWPYPIGTLGEKWGPAEIDQWVMRAGEPQRSYMKDVVEPISALLASNEEFRKIFELVQYGALAHDPDRYTLRALKPRGTLANGKRSVFISGGVHGYETSGVHGAIQFLYHLAQDPETLKKITDHFNIVVVPCVSPWGYERIQRWTRAAKDPNRSFRASNEEMKTEEAEQLVKFLDCLEGGADIDWVLHMDLHETTDSDAIEFSQARQALQGAKEPDTDPIPDGFFLVGDSEKAAGQQLSGSPLAFASIAAEKAPAKTKGLHKAILDAVEQKTHLFIPNPKVKDGDKILGFPVVERAVIYVHMQKINLCSAVLVKSGVDFGITTEVYPDSKGTDGEACNKAQAAAVEAALTYLMSA